VYVLRNDPSGLIVAVRFAKPRKFVPAFALYTVDSPTPPFGRTL
jgi:hypothetical protein